MRKLMGFLLVAVVMGFVVPGAFAATGAHRHQHHRHHHQPRQHRHHAA